MTGLLDTREVDTGRESFTYDSHNRLILYKCEGSLCPSDEYGHRITSQSYVFNEYDPIQLMRTTFDDGTENTATYLTSSEDPTQNISITNSHSYFPAQVSLEYDANGCLTRDEQGRTLEYDSACRLTCVRYDGSIVCEYDYDAAGRLFSQTAPDQPTTYLFYRDDKLIGTKCGDQGISFVTDGQEYWGQQMHSDSESQSQLWIVDSENSVLGWIDDGNEQTVQYQNYTPYGVGGASQPNSPPIGFNGQWRDPITGWYHLGNGYRVYNPVLMRFHVPDSWSPFATGEINPYGYCLGDPVNYVDPTGHSIFGKIWNFFKGLIKKAVGVINFKKVLTTVGGIAVGIFVGAATMTLGLGFGAGVLVGAGIGLLSNAAFGAVGDALDGNTVTWQSVLNDAINGALGGAIGGAIGSAGFTAGKLAVAANFGTKVGSSLVKTATSASLGSLVAETIVSGQIGDAAVNLLDWTPISDNSNPDSEPPSNATSREGARARDPVRVSLKDGEISFSSYKTSMSSQHMSSQHVSGSLNIRSTLVLGPIGSTKSQKQNTGSGVLEILEEKKRMRRALRDGIRKPHMERKTTTQDD